MSNEIFTELLKKHLPEKGVYSKQTANLGNFYETGGWRITKGDNRVRPPKPSFSIYYQDVFEQRSRDQFLYRTELITPTMLDHYLSLPNFSVNSQFCAIPRIISKMKRSYDHIIKNIGRERLMNDYVISKGKAIVVSRIFDSYEYAVKKFKDLGEELPLFKNCAKKFYFKNSSH